MIVSSDYSFLRLATWQGELSRAEVFNRFPDKRSWWIDSDGEVFDAGSDHDIFVKEHPELFDHDEGDTTYYAVRKFWVRVSAWGPSFTINSRNINQKQLDAAQMLYMREGDGKRVEFFQDNVIPASFDKEEFLELKNTNQLKRMRNRVGAGPSQPPSPSDYQKEKFPDKRSWWVDPEGKIYDVGHDHVKFLEQKTKIFGKFADINKALTMNWVRVAFWGGEFVVHCHSIYRSQVEACQQIYKGLGGEHKIYISTLNKSGYISPHDFIWAESASGWIRNLFSDPTGIRQFASRKAFVNASGSVSEQLKNKFPDKRSWWISPEGKAVNSGYDHASFVLENPKIFNGMDESEIMQEDWIKVGDFGTVGDFYIEGLDLNQRQLDAAQEIYQLIGGRKSVFISFPDRSATIPGSEFAAIGSIGELRKEMYQQSRIKGSVTASASEWMKQHFPDKQSWWIDPYGEVTDAGHNHNEFVKAHPEIFGTDEPDLVEDFGWVRVGSMGQDFVISAKSLGERKLREVKNIYHKTNKPYVTIVVGHLSGRITRDEFLQTDTVADLLKEIRVRFAGRRAASADRAWLVSPDGEVINCGHDHEVFVLDHKDFFRGIGYNITSSYQLVKDGWARIGLLGPLLYLDCERLTDFFFKKLQEFTKKLEQAGRVKIGDKVIDRREFLSMDDPIELKFWPSVESRRWSSLPKSRNFLMGVSLEEMSWPLRQAFDLLNLSGKKDKLSANQVASVFQAHDEFLQDHLGRTSTELLQDLNAFFQYGQPKEQIA